MTHSAEHYCLYPVMLFFFNIYIKKKRIQGRLQAWHFLWRSALTKVHLHRSCNWNAPSCSTGMARTWQLTWIATASLSWWLIPHLHILGGDSCTWNWFWKKVLDGRNPTEFAASEGCERAAGLSLIVKLSSSTPNSSIKLLNSKTLVKRRVIHLATMSHKHI